ncbi:hypothetical protein Tco_1392467 [Tanacetum coccineum]
MPLPCHGRGSELGSELTFLVGSELKTSELDTSELQVFEDLYSSQLGKETLPKFLLISELSNTPLSELKVASYKLNSKFVNNMLPKWGRFVTAVKVNRGLRDSNYDQLYAYLKQHEAHANENKMMLD